MYSHPGRDEETGRFIDALSLLAPLPLTLGAAVVAAVLAVPPPALLVLWLVLGALSAGIVSRAWARLRGRPDEREAAMPVYTVLCRRDAYVDYLAEVEADSAEEAVDIAYDGFQPIAWEERGVVEFDARRVVALDADGEEIEETARGRG